MTDMDSVTRLLENTKVVDLCKPHQKVIVRPAHHSERWMRHWLVFE